MLPTRHLNDHEKTTDEETCWYSGSVVDPSDAASIVSEVIDDEKRVEKIISG